MICEQVTLRLERANPTPKNEYIFKTEAAKWFANGIIPESLYLKIQRTDYSKVRK